MLARPIASCAQGLAAHRVPPAPRHGHLGSAQAHEPTALTMRHTSMAALCVALGQVLEVASSDEVWAHQARLNDESVRSTEESGTCCFAEQDKVWVNGPTARGRSTQCSRTATSSARVCQCRPLQSDCHSRRTGLRWVGAGECARSWLIIACSLALLAQSFGQMSAY